jgi:hypothetical protein
MNFKRIRAALSIAALAAVGAAHAQTGTLPN